MRKTYSKYIPEPKFYNKKVRPIWGKNTRITNTLFDCGAKITLEDNVFFGFNCMVLTGRHDYLKRGKDRKNTVEHKPITIKNGAWIGSGAIILGGVTIGRNAVVGAGAVVTKDIPDNELWMGIPAKFKKKI